MMNNIRFRPELNLPPSPTIKDLRAIFDQFNVQYPDLWSYCYPRFYRTTSEHLSAKIPAQCFFNAIFDVLEISAIGHSHTEQIAFAMAVMLHRYRWPHFFVSREFFGAVSRSEPPPGMRWDTLHLPFPAAIFMLPRRSLIHPVNGEVSWIAYARHSTNYNIDFECGPWRRNLLLENAAFSVIFEAHEWANPVPPTFHFTLNANVNPYVSHESIYMSADEKQGATISSDHFLDVPMVEGESEFSQQAVSLVFRLLLAMQARPNFIESARFLGKRLSGRHQPEVWEPNMIGRRYQVVRRGIDEGGGGWHMRMHWRSGHFREQPYGPRREQRKTIWIEPYLVGGDASDGNPSEVA